MSIQDTVRHYIFVIRHNFLLLLSGILISGSITLAISLLLPPVYQAHTLIRVNNAATTANNGTAGNDIFSAQAQAVSYALLVTGSDTLQNAAKQLPGTNATQLQQMVSASPLDNTQIIEVRARSTSPQQAALIANTIANVFITLQIDKESKQLQHTADTLSQTLANTKLQILNAQQQLTNSQNNNAAPQDIARQQSTLDGYQSNYNALLSSYNQIQTQQVLAHTRLSVAQSAIPPTEPSGPSIWLNTLLAAILGLLLMTLVALLRDWFDVTIQSAQDVEHLTGLTALGCIPHSKHTAWLLNLTQEEQDAAREAYTLLGTAFLALPQAARTILVTALRPGAGTSSTTLYLAMTLAQAGQRVLLVDANSRRPTLHTAFGLNNTTGLTGTLQDMAICQQRPDTLPQIWLHQWKTHLPNLWFVPAGPKPAGPVTLQQPALRMLGELFTGNALDAEGNTIPPVVDFLIFDTPSLEEGAYTQSLAAAAEAAILVVEAGKERRETIQHAQTLLQRQGTPVLGIVVNQQRKRHRSYFYSHSRHALRRAPDIQKSLSTKTRHLSNKPARQPLKSIPTSATPPATPPIADAHIQHLPTTPLDDRERETPSPIFIAHAKQDLVLPDAQVSFGDGHPRLQFAPRLHLNNTSGPIKQLSIDSPIQEQ